MWKKIGRLFIVKTRVEAYLITFALATGAMERGKGYLLAYPGFGGWLLFAACSGAVFMAGAKMLDAIRMSAMIEEMACQNGPLPSGRDPSCDPVLLNQQQSGNR